MRHDKKGIDVVPIAVVFHVKKMAKRHTCKIKYQEKKKKKNMYLFVLFFPSLCYLHYVHHESFTQYIFSLFA